MYRAIVQFSNTAPCIAKMTPIMALMEKAASRMIVTRFSVSQSVSLIMPDIIASHLLNTAPGLGEEEYLEAD